MSRAAYERNPPWQEVEKESRRHIYKPEKSYWHWAEPELPIASHRESGIVIWSLNGTIGERVTLEPEYKPLQTFEERLVEAMKPPQAERWITPRVLRPAPRG